MPEGLPTQGLAVWLGDLLVQGGGLLTYGVLVLDGGVLVYGVPGGVQS
jgi:hypothetical protein